MTLNAVMFSFLRGSVHQNQADIPFMVPYYFRGLAGVDSIINPDLAMNLNNRLTLLYLLKHLGKNNTNIISLWCGYSILLWLLSIPTGSSSNENHSKFIESHDEWIYEGIKIEDIES